MTIPRVHTAPGWASNEELTSAQITQVDLNTTYAIDKRSGQTDTLSSHVTIDSTGRITISSDGSIQVTGTSGHQAAILLTNAYSFIGFTGGANALWATGCSALFQTGSTLNVQSDALLQVDFGASFTVACQADILSGGKVRALLGAKFQVLSGANLEVLAGGVATNASVLGVQLTGTAPAKNADPGANNIAIGLNQTKAFGWLRSDGSGGVSHEDGMNVASVAILGTDGWTVTLARAMANSTYSVVATYQIGTGDDLTNTHVPRVKIVSASVFEIRLYNVNLPGASDVSANKLGVSFHVKGRQ